MATPLASTSSKLPDVDDEREGENKAPIKRRKVANNKGKAKETQQNRADWDKAEPWSWYFITEDHSSSGSPIFTKDGNYFFTLSRRSIKITSVLTGELVSTLTHPLSDADLTCLAINPHNAFQLIVGALNGHLIIWDFMDAVLLRTIDIGQPIHRLAAHSQFKDSIFLSVSKSRKSKQNDDSYAVLRVSLIPKANPPGSDGGTLSSSDVVAVGKTRCPTGLAISESGFWLVVTAGHKVYVASTSALKRGFVKYVSPDRLTCLAFHPREDYFATGDGKGVVRLWYCLNDQLNTQVPASGVEKKTQTSAFHWHAHAVSSVCFSSDGAHLFSGGEEAVLVVWQLQSGRKDFVPRVGAPIKTVSSLSTDDREELLLRLADGTTLFLSSSSLKTLRSFSKIKLEHATSYGHSSASLQSPLAYHSATSTLILPSSHPSSLQIFSLPSSKIIGELEVSPSNRVSRKDEKPLEPVRVEKVVVSSSGDWMATIDSRQGDTSLRPEIHLKIWHWDSTVSSWSLNTRIDQPHGTKSIFALCFSPVNTCSPFQLVTSGGDGKVRTWRIQRKKDKNGDLEEYWISRATLNIRCELPQHADWSSDGSILAVTFSSCVTLYDALSCNVRGSLALTGFEMPRSSHFVGQHHLIVSGKQWIALWDILSHSLVWHHETAYEVDRIIPHPTADTFLSVSTSLPDVGRSFITRFTTSTSLPIKSYSLPFGVRNWASTSEAQSPDEFLLAALDSSCGVVILGDNVQTPQFGAHTGKGLAHNRGPHQRSLFQDIFGQFSFTDIPNPTPSLGDESSVAQLPTLSKLFAGPSYLMPPLESFFQPLVDPFLRDRPESAAPDPIVPEMEDDTVMEDIPSSLALSPPDQHVSDQEIQTIVNLFAQQSIHKISRSIPRANGNGKHVHNGHVSNNSVLSPPKVNGKHPAPSTKIKPSGYTQPSTQLVSPPHSPDPVPTINGKKRKKAT